MKKFNVEIEEVLQKIVEIEASDENEALKLVSEQYRKENIVLDENDYKGHELRVISE
ncbi:DpnD/PcfM-like protein [Streptococcus sp. 45]|uniref:DpnD/PcfM-like protein n=1 Tax=Streptococcus equinus TaxID=1335 RepID=A0A1H0QRI8_STREI|nr:MULTISPECIES: DpnD/PcfM family protein [Streptococcus]SDP19971.1 DpnD/PcfM-like protein [Streptococcus equinus]SEI80126.1 DpnD/PcfM-like protein [Streptococcus sp. 45]